MWPSLLARSCSFRARPTARSVVPVLADEVVEDRPGATIKTEGFQLTYRLGLDAVRLRMYRDRRRYGRVDQELVHHWTAASQIVGGRRGGAPDVHAPGCFAVRSRPVEGESDHAVLW